MGQANIENNGQRCPLEDVDNRFSAWYRVRISAYGSNQVTLLQYDAAGKL